MLAGCPCKQKAVILLTCHHEASGSEELENGGGGLSLSLNYSGFPAGGVELGSTSHLRF